MATDVSIRFKAESAQARKEVQNLRGTLTQLNKTLVENRNALLTATGEERKRIQAVQAANAVQKAALQQQIREAQGRKQAIAELQRETRERERAAVQQESAAERARTAQQAAVVELTAGARIVSQQLARLTGGFVQSAADMETFRNSVQAVTRDTAETERILGQLLDLTVELVGIDTGDLISFAGRLTATGLSAEDAITAIRGVTERVAEQGKSAAVTARVLEQLTQAISSSTITAQDFRPIMRELPTLFRDASNALGVPIRSLEDFRNAAEAVGGPVRAIIMLTEEMGRASEGANLDSFNAQMDILRDQAGLLAAELGEHLVPAIVAVLKEVNRWIEEFRDLDDRAQAAIAWAAALATGLTALVAVVGTATVAFGGLAAAANTLVGTGSAGGIAGVGRIFGGAAKGIGSIVKPASLATTALITLVQTWNQIYNDFQRTPPFEDAVETIEALDIAASQTAKSLGVTAQTFQGATAESVTEAKNLISRLDELRGSIVRLSNASGDNREALSAARSEYRKLFATLEDLVQNLPAEELAAPVESLEVQLVKAVDQIERMQDAFKTVSDSNDIQSIEEAASNLTATLKRELDLQLQDTELTAAERLDLELAHAREVENINRGTQNRITEITKEKTEEQTEAVQRQTDARIASAERARKAEVAGYERATQSGASYAEQLAQIGNVSERRAFVALVERLQEQGLSFDEARAEAARYLNLFISVSQVTTRADRAFGDFTSNLVKDANDSKDAITLLIEEVNKLGQRVVGLSLPDIRFADPREQRYFNQNPVGRTLDDIQAEAAASGQQYVRRLFASQDRDAGSTAREAEREFEQTVDSIINSTQRVIGSFSQLDGQLGDTASLLSQLDFGALLGGSPLSAIGAIVDFSIGLYQQAQANQAANAAAQAERIAGFETHEARISGALPRIRAARQITGSSLDGIANSVLDQVQDAIVLQNVEINPALLAQAYQPFIDRLQTAMVSAGDSLQHAIALDLDFGVIQSRFDALETSTHNFYDKQIEAVQAAAALSGNTARAATFALIQERDGIINEATNQLRNLAPALPNNVIAQNNIRRGQSIAESTGTDRDFTEDIARAQYGDVAYDAEVAAATETGVTEEARAAIEALETRTANRLAQEAIQAIGEVTRDVNATETEILEAWNAARPQIENWWQELYDDIVNNPNLLDAERTEALAELGTQQAFVESIRSQYVTPALQGIQQAAEALQTRTANRLATEAINAIGEAASDINVTETEILSLWTAAVPAIETYWQELYEDIVNNPNLSDAEEIEALAELGTVADFVSRIKAQSVTPVLMGIQQATEALETRTATRLAQDAINAISEVSGDVNVTEQLILERWNAAAPFIRTWWQELNDDIVNNPNLTDAEQTEALAELGTVKDFIAGIKSQYVTPVLSGIQQAAEALETRTATRLAQEAINAIGEAANDVNATETLILEQWTAAVPFLQTWWQELHDDIINNPNLSDAARTEALTELGTVESFVANLKAQHVTPVLSGIMQSAEALQTRTANRLAQGAITAIGEAANDVNITEEAILDLWVASEPLIRTWWQELYDDIVNNPNLSGAEQTEALAELGSVTDFVANIKSQYVTPVLRGIAQSQEALETRTANRLANEALTAISDATEDVNVTEEAILALWTAAGPAIQTWYQELYDDIVNNPNLSDAERTEALAELGSVDAFVSNLKSQYVTPILQGIDQTTEALETRTANRLAQDAIKGLGEVASDVNLTEKAILDKWQEAVPFIQTWWQELYDDIVNNANLTDAEVTEALAELGSVESFIGNIRSQYVTPVLNNILGTQFRNRSNAAQNRLNRAQFNLGGATSESDFEIRRGLVIDAINAYYDAEEERIDNLEVSEAELRDLRADNQLAREQALQRATDATNQLAQERIREEERVASDIQDLRDKQIENEQDRLDALADLHKDYQRQLEDIERDGLRRREDLQKEFSRGIEDILRDAGADESLFRHGDFQDILRLAQTPNQDFLRDRLSGLGLDVSDADFERIGDLARQRLRDQQGIETRLSRQRRDAGEGRAERTDDIDAQATATAIALQNALTPLLSEQGALSRAAEKHETAAADISTAATDQTEASNALKVVSEQIQDSDIPGAIDLVKQSAEASLGISSAISALPGLLESSFERIFDDLQKTIVDILEIEAGINQGGSQFILDTLLESGAGVTGILSEVTSHALQSLGINPEQFTPPEMERPDIAAMLESDMPLDVKVINPTDLYDPTEITHLRGEGLNNREIGIHLKEIASLTEPTRPDMSMSDVTDVSALSARLEATEALFATREAPTSLTADTVNVSGSVVNVSGGSAGRESETPQSQFPVESEEMRADITLEFPDSTIQEINNQLLRLKQQDRA